MSTEKPKLYMVCGISGSGKTFYAKKLEEKGVFRLSIDEELWPDFFLLDPLLSGEHRAVLEEQATARIKSRAANLVAEGRSHYPCKKRCCQHRYALLQTQPARGISGICEKNRGGAGAHIYESGAFGAQRAPCRKKGQKRPQCAFCFRRGAFAVLERI